MRVETGDLFAGKRSGPALRGSITVFLTIVFLLFFSLIGVAFEHARILSCEAYLRMSAHSAAMTVFGDYNKELYEEYGLLAYGGYDGKEAEDLAYEMLLVLQENTQYAPDNAKIVYGNLYRLKELAVEISRMRTLSEPVIFTEQIEAYLKSNAIEDLTQEIQKKTEGTKTSAGIEEKLSLTKDYEKGKFEKDTGQGGTKETTTIVTEVEDLAGGNPLEAFIDLMRDGLLGLVCNVGTLSDGKVETREKEDTASKEKEPEEKPGAAEYLEGILKESSIEEIEAVGKDEPEFLDKIKYICYAKDQFSCYTEDRGRTTKYGREYLIAGKQEEKDNLLHVVTKLLGTRLLLNFVTIVADPVLQQKSLATATAIAGFTGIMPVIYAVQYVILLILAFEEACVDVTALLEGRGVPVMKSATDLKIHYEEICLASKALFLKKAGEYSKEVKNKGIFITYEQYIWLFLLGESKELLLKRSLDLIQYDLREKYNQTFRIETCICESNYVVQYQMSVLFEKIPLLSGSLGDAAIRELEVKYGYKNR